MHTASWCWGLKLSTLISLACKKPTNSLESGFSLAIKKASSHNFAFNMRIEVKSSHYEIDWAKSNISQNASMYILSSPAQIEISF